MNVFNSLIVGSSIELKEAINTASVIAATDVTTLIYGESGTGKELFAKGIHQAGARANRPLVSVNCASLPHALAESLLFGHRKGAFTGALTQHDGYVAVARGGTLFLDEIGELPTPTQAKLLRFLESGEYMPLGVIHPLRSNVRIIAATNRDLRQEVRNGNFREDLYYRLSVVPLDLPPLRNRQGDIQPLLNHFAALYAREYHEAPLCFDTLAARALKQYDWPGNVRELRNLVQRLTILMPGRSVTATNLPCEFTQQQRHHARDNLDRFVLPEKGVNLEDLEKSLINQALIMTLGNQSKAARLIGLTRDAFVYRLKKYSVLH